MDRRPGALGDLHVLSDEILCSILDRLAARDVSRLACVSSVMYILCNEEPLWMNLCLRDGGQLEYKGAWKKTFLLRQKLQTPSYEVAATCQPLHFDGFGSLFLYKRWYRRFTTLDAFSVNHDDLERRSNLSLNEFRSSYDVCNPVLITDLTSTWPAKHAWTVDQLLQKYGDVFFTISQRSPKKITMKFDDYVSYIKLQHDEDPLYIFDDEFAEAAPGLLEDYHVPDLFQEDFFDILDKDQRPPFRWLIIGPERSGASWHVDPALTSAWNTLLSGRKRWALYPPGRVPPGVTVNVNEEDGDVHIETPSSLQWWLDTYPLLSEEDKPLECTQQPGETFFVPSGWWHCVLNLEITIAVTQNFVNSSNFEFVCLDMAPGHVHKGVCRAGLLVPEVWNSVGTTDQQENSNEPQNEKGVKGKNGKETNGHVLAENGMRSSCENLPNGEFSYDINFLSKFLDIERDHYTSEWCPDNCIGEREMRGWLHKLWIAKTDMRHLVWKGASLTLNVDKWLTCISEICASHTLPSPLEEEKFPVGTGSNPVYLVSDYVIKLFVEGGLETSLHSLGTEVEFYNVLQKAQSPLLNHVPIIMASGIVVYDNGVCQTKLWNGSDIPDMKQNCITSDTNHDRESSHFGVWTKMHFGCIKSKAATSAKMFPYIITRRCKGDILANLKDVLSEKDVLNLASFLGYQLRNLHALPIPLPRHIGLEDVDKIYLGSQHLNYLGEAYMLPKYPSQQANTSSGIPLECKLFIASLNERRRDLVGRLRKWGGPIPESLIKNVEEYVPHDIALLLNFTKSVDDMNLFCGSLTWLHSDIMDDNIHMEPCFPENCSSEALDANLMVNHKVPEFGKEEFPKKWHATHILDYGNLRIGDPINDFIPLYLDILRGDSSLLKQVLASYGLPLLRNSNSSQESCKKFQKLSYRAMCYCILHEDNVLGAIFSLWKDLKSAKSWEEVEEVVWGELNGYVPSIDC